MPAMDIGVAAFAAVLLVVWPLWLIGVRALERRRPPTTPTGDGGRRVECVHCEGLGAAPSRSGPVPCDACGGTGVV